MSREIKRVPLEFDHPLGEVWPGYLLPENLHAEPCESCGGSGYSPFARRLREKWYGYSAFDPSETGSTPFTVETLPVRELAERNVKTAPWFYGTGELAIVREAKRLADYYNGQWMHHLQQEDVDVLIKHGRLTDFTHTWSKDAGWELIDPVPVVTVEDVNLWSLSGLSHDSINCMLVIKDACERAGEPDTCSVCAGAGAIERYPGQRIEAENWSCVEPPTGKGYQLWETVSEGSPKSPVFANPEDLATWIRSHGTEFDGCYTPHEDLVSWIRNEGSSIGTGAVIDGSIISGVELAARYAKDER